LERKNRETFESWLMIFALIKERKGRQKTGYAFIANLSLPGALNY